MTDQDEFHTTGSWTPTILVSIAFALRWIAFGEGNLPISIRRWLSMKRVELRKKLGYRDETKYKMSAGDGANQKYKRQG
eukprot:CAMPEP_0184855242 /NCGR_PEP_ID=MMETSP0580-20130426/544_1 /TAXON_ID=1118495 /ORGANISM="Dactyliosolen fragilissimus" /LENGTH=78 /DNA_ID=CAMNT_0027349705 /DNA_START=36 /DNA_END=272 /DNA_ORIENTATION=+